MEPIAFACTIDPAGLKQRVNQLDALAPHVRGLRRDGLTLTLAFPAEATQDVQAFVVEESKCCPFFSFQIDEINQGVRLGIRTPPGGEAMLDALQAALAGMLPTYPTAPTTRGPDHREADANDLADLAWLDDPRQRRLLPAAPRHHHRARHHRP